MMSPRTFNLLLASVILSNALAFTIAPIITTRRTAIAPAVGPLFTSSEDSIVSEEEDEDEAEPGKMRVSEIKAELNMRGVTFDDCFDKESMAARLMEARATGKANPEILNDFNKKKLEENFSGEKMKITDEDVERIKANDGTLPGGMDPEMLNKLMSSPEIMALLQSPKMQEAMKLTMTGGPEELEKAIKADPELLTIVEKLNEVMGL